MYNIITAVPMCLSWFFRLKPIERWVSRRAKKLHSIHSLSIPTIKYYHTYMSQYVIRMSHTYVMQRNTKVYFLFVILVSYNATYVLSLDFVLLIASNHIFLCMNKQTVAAYSNVQC